MIKISTKKMRMSAKCINCNRLMTNPGYGKNNVLCCGKYRQWWEERTYTVEHDDGRNNRGMFDHKPNSRIISSEISIDGGR